MNDGYLPDPGEDLTEFIFNPHNAQLLSGKILENARHGTSIIVEHNGEKIELYQAGTKKENR